MTQRSIVAASVVCVLAVAGCSSKGYDKFIPTEERARQALEAALNAWQEGKEPGEVAGAPMPVQAVDSQWRAGKKLTAFEIVGQEPGDGPPVFTVNLTVQGEAKPRAVRYIVLGKDPLWVYREDDYKAPAGM